MTYGERLLTEKILGSEIMLTRKVEQIDLNKNAVYIVKNGEIIEIESPSTGYGSQKIIWQHGKPIRVELTVSEIL